MKSTAFASIASLAVAIVMAGGCSSTNSATNSTADAGDDALATVDTGASSGGSSGSSGSGSGSGSSSSSSSSSSGVAESGSETGAETGPYGNTGQPACDAINLPAPASTSGVQYQIGITLGPGQERQVCQLVKLGQDLDMNWSQGNMTNGAHHALVYRTSYNGTIPATTRDGQTLDGTLVHDCSTPTALWDVGGIIAGAQGQNAGSFQQGQLPSNVAVKLKAGDYLLLNFHLLNPSNQTINACYKANLNGVPDSQVTQEAGLLFWYNPYITVPASGTATARMTCPVTQDITMANAVSHAHARLTNYVASLMTADPEAGGTKVQDLFTGTAWDSPVTKLLSPALAITKGHWIDYHCDYTNPEARNVAQGQQTTDEMCMFVALYWPRDPNLDYCVSPNGNAYFGGHSYGFGTKTGADFLQCFWTNPLPTGPGSAGGPGSSAARYAADSCVTQTCPKASGPITPYIDCVQASAGTCQTQCTDLQSSFQAVCASTPDSTVTGADGGATSGKTGCKAQYGTNGSDGTCAAQAQTAAIAASTTAAQTAELTAQCQQTFCAAECAPDASIPDGGVSCAACVGAFTGSTSNPSCLNQLTLAAVAAQTKTLAQACVTQCFTDCITTRATGCTLDCINKSACSSQYNAVAAATCN